MSITATSTQLLGLDWGTSQLRAYRIAADGSILERRDGGPGILAVDPGGFPAVLSAFAGDWLVETPIAIASGMVGSRQGWLEVPYVSCPAGLDDLAAGLATTDAGNGATVHLVPGVVHESANGVPDVMRGEETQVIGALGAHEHTADALLPGTHSKWVSVCAGRIVRFTTYMTGEVFGLLAEHSILGRMMDGDADDPQAFEGGVDAGLDEAGGLLGRLFSARTLALFDRLESGAVHAYLSGLTIGAELREALTSGDAPDSVTIIGGDVLAERYARALARAGVKCRVGAADAAAHGLVRIARACKMLEPLT